MSERAEVIICRGPPQCEGGEQEGCPWCIRIDPHDPDWEEKLEREQRGN